MYLSGGGCPLSHIPKEDSATNTTRRKTKKTTRIAHLYSMVSGRERSNPTEESGVPPAYEGLGQNHLVDGLYILTNKMSRTVLDLSGGYSTGGTRCAGFSPNVNDFIDHQLWILKRDATADTYTLKNLRGGTYLDLRGKQENGSQVTCYPRSSDARSSNQEWRIIEQSRDEFTIQCIQTKTYLEIPNGNSWSGTNVTCSTKVDDGAHQLWHVERVSRTSQEIKDLLEKWKPDTTKQLFQPYGDDAEYFVLPYELRKTIWDGTKLQRQTVRKHVFDYDDFVIKSKDAVSSWARDRLRVDGYSILFGTLYGKSKGGPRAYNWYLSGDMHDLIFFDAQTGREYTPAALTSSEFEPTFATL